VRHNGQKKNSHIPGLDDDGRTTFEDHQSVPTPAALERLVPDVGFGMLVRSRPTAVTAVKCAHLPQTKALKKKLAGLVITWTNRVFQANGHTFGLVVDVGTRDDRSRNSLPRSTHPRAAQRCRNE